MQLDLREPRTGEEFEKYYDLRWRILRAPWTQERTAGQDEHEERAVHLTAWAGNRMVGAGRLHFLSPDEARVRGMAVELGYERQGIGSLILKGLEERAAQMGAKHIVLDARDTAIQFYRKHGYELVDRSYTLFDAIIHWRMRKDL